MSIIIQVKCTTPKQLIDLGQKVTFTVSVRGGQIPYTYLWDFGDENTSNAISPTYTYYSEETFHVKITVTDVNQQSESSTTNIGVVDKNAESSC